MSAIKFYTFGPSPPCRSVHMTAAALGVELDMKMIDLFKEEHLAEEYRKINPAQTIPYIVDGDFGLRESRAINKYLVGKYGGEDNKLYPKDIYKRAEIDQLLDNDLGLFYRTMVANAFFPFRKQLETTPEMDAKITKSFQWLDQHLKDRKFMAGNDLTVADFSYVVGFLAHTISNKENMSDYPNAMAWYARMKELPYFMEVNKPYFETLEILKQRK